MNENVNEKLLREKKPIFPQFGKAIVFCLLIAILITLIVLNQSDYSFGVRSWYVTFPAAIVLLGENAIKFWVAKRYPVKTVCYVFDILSLMVLTLFSDGTLISILYLSILSEFYLNQKSVTASVAMWLSSMFIFLVTFALSSIFKSGGFSLSRLLSNAFNDIILFIVHFFAMNFVVQLARKTRELSKTAEDLTSSNEKLRIAYDELKEITALEERQRIAKDIHDTAGHSITTVIMQTEAAKLLIDVNPEEAKAKVISANIQAKNALDQMRESVHLLAGRDSSCSLKEELEEILAQTMDGTGVKIRCALDDVQLAGVKRRFIANSLKECLANGMRHGGASAFYVELSSEAGVLCLTVSDNGCGLPDNFKEGFGLRGIREKAVNFGGGIVYESESGDGCEIKITINAE